MGTLYIIRHGQASFLSRDYDNLSDLGWEQGRRLARYWLKWNIRPDRIVIGPRKRHRQTYDAVAEIFKLADVPLPEPESMDAFDEFAADKVMRAGIASLVPTTPELQPAVAAMSDPQANRERNFQRIFEFVTRAWVRGELNPAGAESFQAFRDRVEAGLEDLLRESGRGANIAIFTSGGPVAASTGHLLHLADEKTLELSWMVRNSSYNEILYSGDRRSLLSFAAIPHIDEPHLLTFR